jgi:hypothetical protein
MRCTNASGKRGRILARLSRVRNRDKLVHKFAPISADTILGLPLCAPLAGRCKKERGSLLVAILSHSLYSTSRYMLRRLNQFQRSLAFAVGASVKRITCARLLFAFAFILSSASSPLQSAGSGSLPREVRLQWTPLDLDSRKSALASRYRRAPCRAGFPTLRDHHQVDAI